MECLLTECTKTDISTESIDELYELYSWVPQTQCLRSDCRKQCCSKTDESVMPNGKFMSLPLIYSVEYWNIDSYIRENLGHDVWEKFYMPKQRSRLCVFFDEASLNCTIYPARPLSCRLFGLDLPNTLWGLEFEQEAMKNILCKSIKMIEPEKYKQFVKNYQRIWERMAILSVRNPVLTKEQSQAVKEQIGYEDIYLLGWLEFNRLRFSNKEWFKKELGNFWSDYEQSL